MFDSFQLHPRPTNTSGQHGFGMHSGFVIDDETKFGWRDAPEVSFSKPFENDLSPALPPVEAAVHPYDAL